MSTNPQLTFLMSTYNGRAFLRPAIESVLAQTHSDWRMLIVDDGSTDGTPELADQYRDPRIRVARMSQNAGQTVALNTGLAMVDTPWIARLDQDDLAGPRRAELQLAHVSKHPSTVLVGSWADWIDEEGNSVARFRPPTAPAAVRRELYRRPVPIFHSAATYSTDAVRSVGGYPTELSYAQDYALWVKLAAVGEIANVGQVLAYVRRHQQKTSMKPGVAIRQIAEGLTIIEGIEPAMRLRGAERQRWHAGRLRLVTQRAIAAAHDRNWRMARHDMAEVLAGALRNPLVAADLLALVGESLSYRTGLTRRRASRR
jgi:glycosyltransferase involved in cell wall biosynthesis